MTSIQNSTIILYKSDMGTYGNIMPIHIFTILLPKTTKEQLWQQRIKM